MEKTFDTQEKKTENGHSEIIRPCDPASYTGAQAQEMGACFPGRKGERSDYKASLVDPESGRSYALSDEHNVLGRDPHCAVRLQSQYVARIHAVIWKGRGSCTLRDLRSTNGSFVNGKRLEPGQSVRLSDGDRIMLAATRLIFRESGETRDRREPDDTEG